MTRHPLDDDASTGSVGVVDAGQASDTGSDAPVGLPWDPPPIPEAGAIFAGIPDCAPIFLDDDGVCRPRIDACAKNELVLPRRGCVALAKVAASPEAGQEVLDVVNDGVAAAGGGVGLTEALQVAATGAVLRLSPGSYAGGFWITRDVHIQGAGAPVTTIDNVTVDSGHLTLTDATLESASDTVTVAGAGYVTLERVHVLGHGQTGINCYSGARCVARQTRFTPAGYAIYIHGSAQVELDQVTLAPGEASGSIICNLSTGKLTVNDSVLGDVASAGVAFVPRCWFESLKADRSVLTGLDAVVASRWDISDSWVVGGFGSWAADHVQLRRTRSGGFSTIAQFHANDVIVEGATRRDRHGNLPANPDFVSFGGVTVLDRVSILGGDGDGVVVESKLTANGLQIKGTRAADATPAVGLRVRTGATASLVDSVIEHVQGHGITVVGTGSLKLTRTTVRDSLPPPEGELAYGIIANFGPTVTINGSRIERVHGIALWAVASTVGVDGLWIDSITPGDGIDPVHGLIHGLSDGIIATNGATLDAKGLHIRGTERVAVLSDVSSGRIEGHEFDRCRTGLATTGSVDAWQLEQVDNRCERPVWSKTSLAVPRLGIQ